MNMTMEKARGEVKNEALSRAMKGNQNARKSGDDTQKNKAILMVEYSKDEYNRLFPEGTAQTPLGAVKMGRDQFAKLGRKDGGSRRSYIGAAYQTLTDPLVILKEGTDYVYIKSFTTDKGVSTFMSVEKDNADGRFVVTNYMRHKGEVINKIKRADSIAYLLGDRGSPARMGKEGVLHAQSSHTHRVSPKPLEKSNKKNGTDAIREALRRLA